MPRPAIPFLLALLLAGCVHSPLVPPRPTMPAPYAETIGRPPATEQPLIWQPGHWDYRDGGYAWTRGAWVARAGHGPLWQEGYWALKDNSWSWVGPHWAD